MADGNGAIPTMMAYRLKSALLTPAALHFPRPRGLVLDTI